MLPKLALFAPRARESLAIGYLGIWDRIWIEGFHFHFDFAGSAGIAAPAAQSVVFYAGLLLGFVLALGILGLGRSLAGRLVDGAAAGRA